MSCAEKQFRVEAANAFFGRRHKTCIDLENATAVTLDGTHLLLSSLETEYYLWFNLDGVGTDPAIAGRTAIEVMIATNDNTAALKTKMIDALELILSAGTREFYAASESTTCICIEVFKLGAALSDSLDGDTGLVVTTEIEGSYSNLGCLAEDFDFSPEISEVDITCHQEGETPIDKIITGFSLDIELGLLDTSKERIRELIGLGVGNIFTPTGGTELIGIGSSTLGKSAFDLGGELRLMPVNDPTRSWIFPLAVAKLNSISFSSVEKQVLTITFSVLLDRKARPEVNFANYGEVDQVIR